MEFIDVKGRTLAALVASMVPRSKASIDRVSGSLLGSPCGSALPGTSPGGGCDDRSGGMDVALPSIPRVPVSFTAGIPLVLPLLLLATATATSTAAAATAPPPALTLLTVNHE